MSIKQNGGVFGRNPTFNDVTIEGQLTFEGNIDIDSDITWEDDKKALFGNNGELAIYHHNNGTSFIQETGTGSLNVLGTDFRVMNAAGTENKIVATTDGAVTLYHNNQPKIATTTSGVDVTGSLSANSLIMTNGAASFSRTHPTTNASLQVLDLKATSSGDMANGFGPSIHFSASDTGATSDQVAEINVVRAGSDTAFNIELQTADATRMTIGSGGVDVTGNVSIPNGSLKVGAGTTTPWASADDLVVNSTTTAGVSVLTPDSNNGRFVIGSASDTDYLQIEGFYNSGSPLGRIRTGGTIAMTFDASQNVSIPNGSLSVDAGGSRSNLSNTHVRLTDGFNVEWGGGTNYIRGSNASNEVKIATNTADAIVVNSSQNVSIPNGTLSLSVGSLNVANSDLNIDGDTGIRFQASSLMPRKNGADDATASVSLGLASHRFSEIFAANGTINTSDRNEKQDIESLTEAEERVAVAAKSLLKKFRWKDAVEAKGDDARIHFGIIAQDLQAAFEAESLDAGRYGMFTSNTWWEHDVEVPAVEAVEGVEGVATVEAQDAVMGEREKMETVETGTYVNLAGETITETQEVGVTEEQVQTVVERQDIDGVMTEVEVEKTVSVPVMESYEISPAVEAVAGVEAVEAVEAADAYTRTDTYDTAEEAPEGSVEKTRMGVRYSELLAFIISAI